MTDSSERDTQGAALTESLFAEGERTSPSTEPRVLSVLQPDPGKVAETVRREKMLLQKIDIVRALAMSAKRVFLVLQPMRTTTSQSRGNRLITPEAIPTDSNGTIRRRQRLGGMLNYYCCRAA